MIVDAAAIAKRDTDGAMSAKRGTDRGAVVVQPITLAPALFSRSAAAILAGGRLTHGGRDG